MEHKLVEKARAMLQQNEKAVLLMRQHHDKEITNNRSGMICSGSQLIAFIPLTYADKEIIKKISLSEKGAIHLSPKKLHIIDEPAEGLQYKTDEDWYYSEAIDQRPVIHIIGGGHVGLALSELMHYLGFYIKLYDNRPELNTIAENSFADEKHIVNYDSIGNILLNAENDFVVIMTIGYRTDKTVLQQLINRSFYYIGLLGSEHKINIILNEFKAEGISAGSLQNIHTPVGINIFSKTAKEIAVSIAAEIIREKNKGQPGGRIL